MTDGKIESLDERRKRARTKLGAPEEVKPDAMAAIRSLRAGDKLLGLPPRDPDGPRMSGELPPHCPVRPLGRDGDVFYFINAAGGLGELTPTSSGKGHIDALFSGAWPYLVWAWGRKKFVAKGLPPIHLDNYDAEKVRSALFDAATAKGSWNSVDMVRGRGAWLGARGELVLHLGDRLLIDGKEEAPCGERDGFLYPGRPPVPGPDPSRQPAGPDAAGKRALAFLQSWSWNRPDLDPLLLLGWIAAAGVGGALSWRPTVFITGDAATGKSTLQQSVAALLGGALIQSVETTAAGIYQVLKNDCLPVAVDEMEAAADGRKAKSVIELARVANSGGRMLRGGQDHNGRQFDLRSPFLFSAINAPPLRSQDRSRMALLNLKPLPKIEGGAPIDLSELGQIGRQVFRRIIDWWPRLGELREEVRHWLVSEAGHDGRGADTFGTLIAFAHAALSDDMPSDADLARWCDLLKANTLAELEARTPNWQLCLRHILQVRADALRSESNKTVGALLMDFQPGKHNDQKGQTPEYVRKKLAEVGLGLVGPVRGRLEFKTAWLFVPNDHSSLAPLFDGTVWAGEGGAPGVWTDALRQSPRWDARTKKGLHRQGNGRVGLMPLRGTLLKLKDLFEAVGDVPMGGPDTEEDDE